MFAIKDLGQGFFSSKVPEGTKGRIVGVEEHFWSDVTYHAKFDNEEIEEVSENDIAEE